MYFSKAKWGDVFNPFQLSATGYLFDINIEIVIFQVSWYKNKIALRVNAKSTLFQRWLLSLNQRWQINVESTWILRWPTSRRYFNIFQRWINIECLLGTVSKGQKSISYFGSVIWNSISAELMEINSFQVFKSEINAWQPTNRPYRLCKNYIENLGFVNIAS